jgi:hypothetical protein
MPIFNSLMAFCTAANRASAESNTFQGVAFIANTQRTDKLVLTWFCSGITFAAVACRVVLRQEKTGFYNGAFE